MCLCCKYLENLENPLIIYLHYSMSKCYWNFIGKMWCLIEISYKIYDKHFLLISKLSRNVSISLCNMKWFAEFFYSDSEVRNATISFKYSSFKTHFCYTQNTNVDAIKDKSIFNAFCWKFSIFRNFLFNQY